MTTYLVQLQPMQSKLGTSTHTTSDTVNADVMWVNDSGALLFMNDDSAKTLRAYAPGTWREVRIKAEPEPVPKIKFITAEDATDGD